MELEMQKSVAVEQSVGAIVATVESEVEVRLAAMEGAVFELRASRDSLRLLLDELKGSASANIAASAGMPPEDISNADCRSVSKREYDSRAY